MLISAAFFSRCLDLNFIENYFIAVWFGVLDFSEFLLLCFVLNSHRGFKFYMIFGIDSFIACLDLLGGTNYR